MPAHTTDLGKFDERLRKLERENRWLKRAGAAVLLVFGTVLIMGQAPASRTVQAQSFELRDASGNLRASLALKDGEPLLAFYDTGSTSQQVALGTFRPPGMSKRVSLYLYGDHAGIFVVGDNADLRWTAP